MSFENSDFPNILYLTPWICPYFEQKYLVLMYLIQWNDSLKHEINWYFKVSFQKYNKTIKYKKWNMFGHSHGHSFDSRCRDLQLFSKRRNFTALIPLAKWSIYGCLNVAKNNIEKSIQVLKSIQLFLQMFNLQKALNLPKSFNTRKAFNP